MWVKTEKGGQLKDPEIRDAHVIVFDYKHVESDTLRRTKLIGTPYFLVGATDGVTWSTCLRPIVAMLRAVVSDRVDGEEITRRRRSYNQKIMRRIILTIMRLMVS